MNLLVFTLIITLLQNVVKAIGQNVIIELVWNVFIKISSNPTLQKLNHLKQDQLQTYKQQQRISAQDEYAKWTKLNRKLDQLKKDIDETSTQISSQRTKFNGTLNTVFYIILKLPILFISIWYRSTPVYYLPLGILPGWLVWFLRFPSAPPNSIGITVWCFSINTICDTLIKCSTLLIPVQSNI